MLNEDQVRELLLKAGATVPIGAESPIEPAPRRPWLPIAAAVAVAATIVAVYVAVGGSDDNIGESPAPGTTAWPPDVPNAYHLADDQMPLLFGWRVEDARAELERHGYLVAERVDESCDLPGRVVRTEPDVGARLQQGEIVTLVTPEMSRDAKCDYADQRLAWSIIDFATGRGDAPKFADRVDYYFGDLEHETFSRDEAEDPAAWDTCASVPERCPISPWRQLLRSQFALVNGSPVMPHLELSSTPAHLGCHEGDDPLDSERQALGIVITTWIDDFGAGCSPSVQVLTTDGAIDTVVLASAYRKAELPYAVDVETVTGMTEPEARESLENQGLLVEVLPAPGTKTQSCFANTPPIVASQDPAGGETVYAQTSVLLAMRWVRCGESEADSVGPRFVDFARMTSTLNRTIFAPQVDLYLGNQLVKTITNAQAYRRDAWQICPPGGGYAEASCPFSAVDTIKAEEANRIVYTETHPVLGPCATGSRDADLPAGLFVTIGIAEPDSCMNNWNVEIYYRDDGLISGVNLLLGSP